MVPWLYDLIAAALNSTKVGRPDPLVEWVRQRDMTPLTEELERRADTARKVVDTVLAPWGGSEVCIDGYETTVRIASDMQLIIARTFHVEPVPSIAAACANLTRDLGATQISAARWFLDA